MHNFFDLELTAPNISETTKRLIKSARSKSSSRLKKLVSILASRFYGKKSGPLQVYLFNAMGLVFYDLGRSDKTVACFEQALTIADKIEDPDAEAKVLSNIGTLYEIEGRWEWASYFYEKSLMIFERHGDGKNASRIRGQVLDAKAANNYWGHQATNRGLRKKLSAAERHNKLGEIFCDAGYLGPALIHFRLAKKMSKKGELVKTLTIQGSILARQKKNTLALDCFQKATKLPGTRTQLIYQAIAWNNLGLLYKQQKEYEKAVRSYSKSMKIKTAQHNWEGMGTTFFNLVNLYIEIGEYDKAHEIIFKANRIDRLSQEDRKEIQALNMKIPQNKRSNH